LKNGILYIILTSVVFTTLEPVSKLIANEISPMMITFLRFFLGGLILLPFSILKIKKQNIRLVKKDYISMLLLGILCICVSMVLLQYAVLHSDSPALTAIIFSSNSVFTIIFAALILKDRITPIKVLAVILCITGVIICADFKSGTNLISLILAVVSALTFSLYTVLSKKLMTKVTGIIQTSFSFLSGSLVLLIVLLCSGDNSIVNINGGNLVYLIYLAVAVTGIGYWSYFKAMEKASALAASSVFFIKPILTPFAAFFINGIAPGLNLFIALVLVLAGSYLSIMVRNKC
jgi:drug/metabolite transporter (DMT)-like permease